MEYSVPVLALIFLKYADHKFAAAEKALQGAGTRQRKRSVSKSDYLGSSCHWLRTMAHKPS